MSASEPKADRRPAASKEMSDAQLDAVAALAVAAQAAAHPVFDTSGRITEVAIWERGEWTGSVRLGRAGRLEAWSSIGDRWWKPRDMEHAVSLAIEGKENRGFQRGNLPVGGLGASAAPLAPTPLPAAA